MKNTGRFSCHTTFLCIFSFQSVSAPKWTKWVRICQNTIFFTPCGQNMQLRKKSHKIKKIARSTKVIPNNRDMWSWVRGSQWWAKGPPLILETVKNLQVGNKIKVAQEGIIDLKGLGYALSC